MILDFVTSHPQADTLQTPLEETTTDEQYKDNVEQEEFFEVIELEDFTL